MANEKRLIDANALKANFVVSGEFAKDLWHASTIQGTIDNATTVDAVEVVHGHMVERIVDHECPWYTIYDCSECGCTVERWHSYCPNCGAKMDGDGNV